MFVHEGKAHYRLSTTDSSFSARMRTAELRMTSDSRGAISTEQVGRGGFFYLYVLEINIKISESRSFDIQWYASNFITWHGISAEGMTYFVGQPGS